MFCSAGSDLDWTFVILQQNRGSGAVVTTYVVHRPLSNTCRPDESRATCCCEAPASLIGPIVSKLVDTNHRLMNQWTLSNRKLHGDQANPHPQAQRDDDRLPSPGRRLRASCSDRATQGLKLRESMESYHRARKYTNTTLGHVA